jgi:hypothetical protein
MGVRQFFHFGAILTINKKQTVYRKGAKSAKEILHLLLDQNLKAFLSVLRDFAVPPLNRSSFGI